MPTIGHFHTTATFFLGGGVGREGGALLGTMLQSDRQVTLPPRLHYLRPARASVCHASETAFLSCSQFTVNYSLALLTPTRVLCSLDEPPVPPPAPPDTGGLGHCTRQHIHIFTIFTEILIFPPPSYTRTYKCTHPHL